MIAGQTIGCFEVVRLASPGAAGRHKRFLVRCRCGREMEKATTDIKRQQSCGCERPKFDAATTMYSHLRGRHSKHAGEMISFDQFVTISQCSCHYCGSPPRNRTYGWNYTGIDRIDSSQGYVAANVRPCCWTCNRMKGDLTEGQFVEQLKRILTHFQLPFSKYPG